MKEFAEGWRQGIEYSTKIDGKSLIQVINGQTHVQKDIIASSHINNDQSRVQLVGSESINAFADQQMIYSSTPMISSANHYSVNSNLSGNYVLLNGNQIVESVNMSRNQSHLSETNIFKTPNKNDLIDDGKSPRRKGFPKRRTTPTSKKSDGNMTPFKSPFKSPLSGSSLSFDDSSPMPNSASSKISADEPIVQPEIIVEELINFPSMHETIADKINKLFDMNDGNLKEHEDENCSKDDSHNKTITNEDVPESSHENPVNDHLVQNILASLEDAPEFNALLDMITEKELLMTPYKSNSSPFSSSASSLNTPVPRRIQEKSVSNTNVVKNLMMDLKTPEKVNFNRTNQLTSVNISPIKIVSNTHLNSPYKTVYIPPAINEVPTVINTNINKSNVITSQGEAVVIRFDPSQSQTLIPNSAQSIKTISFPNQFNEERQVKGKKINFNKPASELQMKKSMLMPRKILPKTTSPTLTTMTTTTTATISNAHISQEQNGIQIGEIQIVNRILPNQRLGKNKRVIRKSDYQQQIVTLNTSNDNSINETHKNDEQIDLRKKNHNIERNGNSLKRNCPENENAKKIKVSFINQCIIT